MVRVYELARDLNMTNKKLLEKIRDLGIPVKSHMTSLDDDAVARIKTEILGKKKKIVPAKIIKLPITSDSTEATDTVTRFKARILKNKTKMVREGNNKKPISSDKNKKLMKEMVEKIEEYREPYLDKPYLAEAISANNRDQDKFLSELENYVDDILNLIEQINKRCDYAPSRKVFAPIRIPRYPKNMEKALKSPAQDETLFSNFSNNIFKLFVDGHKKVMDDRAIISKSEFLGFASSLLGNIRLFRNDLHHLDITDSKKKEMGRLYNEVCGKNVLDDPNSRLKFQVEMLKRTAEVLEKECELVKEKISKLS